MCSMCSPQRRLAPTALCAIGRMGFAAPQHPYHDLVVVEGGLAPSSGAGTVEAAVERPRCSFPQPPFAGIVAMCGAHIRSPLVCGCSQCLCSFGSAHVADQISGEIALYRAEGQAEHWSKQGGGGSRPFSPLTPPAADESVSGMTNIALSAKRVSLQQCRHAPRKPMRCFRRRVRSPREASGE